MAEISSLNLLLLYWENSFPIAENVLQCEHSVLTCGVKRFDGSVACEQRLLWRVNGPAGGFSSTLWFRLSRLLQRGYPASSRHPPWSTVFLFLGRP